MTTTTLPAPAASTRRVSGALRALLVIQAVIGYEWFASGLTKVYLGDFASGLAAQLRDQAKGTSGWYRGFLDSVVIPHAHVFGYLIESSELLAGIVLIATALALLPGRLELAAGTGRALRIVTGLVSTVCALMALNFLFASGVGVAHPIAADSFDEGVSLDALLVGLQLALAGYGLAAVRLRLPARSPLRAVAALAALVR